MGRKPKRLPFKISIPKSRYTSRGLRYDMILEDSNVPVMISLINNGEIQKDTCQMAYCRHTVMSLKLLEEFKAPNTYTDFALPVPLPQIWQPQERGASVVVKTSEIETRVLPSQKFRKKSAHPTP